MGDGGVRLADGARVVGGVRLTESGEDGIGGVEFVEAERKESIEVHLS